MNELYVLSYIHTDKPEYSEVYGVYRTKDKAVKKLLEVANYRKDKNGNLTQYYIKNNDYTSYDFLKNKVLSNMELVDEDIYRITPVRVS